ncbi:MAG: hypothetical protein ACRC5T_03255, partial [Cetobacterium sp.]
DGEGKAIFKDPITDSGMKKSARGRIAVVDGDNDLELRDGDVGALWEITDSNVLAPVWADGKFLRHQSYDDVRATLGHTLL